MSQIGYNHELNCAVSVRNLDAAIDWYQHVLGFKVRNRMDQIRFAILETAVRGVVIGLSEGEASGSAGVALTWGVTDIEAARDAITAAGANSDGPIVDIPGVVRLLSFSDPDGNKHQFWAPPKA